MRRANRTVTCIGAFLLVAGLLATSGRPMAAEFRLLFAVPIAAVVIAAFWSLFEVPCLSCGKSLGSVGFRVAHGRSGDASPRCPHCGISVDAEIP